MALSRSASGPGLSINTSSANSLFGSGTTPASGGMFGNTQTSKPGGLFGSTASAPQTGGLFGSTTTTSAPAASGLFGSTTSSAPAAGGLFGAAPSSAPAAGGLFGSTAKTQPAGGLFGSTTTPQPASGGLFGSTPAATQPTLGFNTTQAATQQQQQPQGGLFGSTTTSQAQSSGGLFGGGAQSTGGGLFGGLNQQTQTKPAGGSLFGGLNQSTQQAQPQAQQSGMFASTNRLGGSTNVQSQQQAVPGVRIDVSNVRGTTRFSDLHEDLQKQITQLDTLIQNQINFHDQCAAFMPSHEAQLSQIPNDVEFCRRKLIGLENGQDSDVQSIALASQLVRLDADHATLSFKAIDNLKLPPQYHNSGMWQAPSESSGKGPDEAQDIVGFFSKTADELAATLEKYQGHFSEIETHLRGVEAASAQQINALVARQHGSARSQSNPVEDLAAVLKDFEQSLLGVAGRVGGAREAVQSAQLDGFTDTRNGRNESNGTPVNGFRRGIY